MPHVLLSYATAPDYLERRAEHRAAHLALAWAASDRGELLLGGAVGNPPEEAMLLFTSAAAAEAFAAADPYVAAGLITAWRVRPWATVVGQHAADPIRP